MAARSFLINAGFESFGLGQSARCLKIINVSETLGGIGSVAMSAVPVLEKTTFTSGIVFTAFSTSSCIRVLCSMPVLGIRMACIAMSPSSSRGMNSCPSRVN